MLTSFNVVIFTTIDNVKETSKKMSEGGATMTQTGHFYVQENSRQTQGTCQIKMLFECGLVLYDVAVTLSLHTS